MVQYLDIQSTDVPVSKVFEIGENSYTITILYNAIGDFFTAEFKDEDGVELFIGKLVYWSPLNHMPIKGLEEILIVPADTEDIRLDKYNHENVTVTNFGEVKLLIL